MMGSEKAFRRKFELRARPAEVHRLIDFVAHETFPGHKFKSNDIFS
jgi:hypothetical protein